MKYELHDEWVKYTTARLKLIRSLDESLKGIKKSEVGQEVVHRLFDDDAIGVRKDLKDSLLKLCSHRLIREHFKETLGMNFFIPKIFEDIVDQFFDPDIEKQIVEEEDW